MYLVDTNVISAAAPSKAKSLRDLVAWMEAQSAHLYLSVVTIAEIEDGIAKLRRAGATRKANTLSAWLETLLHLYGDRVLAFDTPTARIVGALSDRARSQGASPGFADLIIAATAQVRHFTVLTRNSRHFVPLGVPVLDPFEALPPIV